MKHFEYVHNTLKELHALIPTKDGFRHSITLCEVNELIKINVFYQGAFYPIYMDSLYEENETYKELVKGIFEIVKVMAIS